jgi:hypothetical protein
MQFSNLRANNACDAEKMITKAEFQNGFVSPSPRWSAQTTSGIWCVISSHP